MSPNSETIAIAKLRAPLLMLSPDAVNLDACLNDLTEQQMQVVMLLSQGHSNKTIAHALARSQATVKSHITAILRVLGCTNRTQAALLIFQWLAKRSNRSANVVSELL